MGRQLGAFDPDNNIDRPDLNKCPDCECFFAGDNCPLCGKECPEEMRAGNRKPVKQPKRRSSGGSGRVTFIEWYHSWWFIILMSFFSPVIGAVLLFTSPHKKKAKITFVALAILYFVLQMYGFGLISGIVNLFDKPVDTSLSREEYISACEMVSAEEFYRSVGEYDGDFISMELTVKSTLTDWDGAYNNEKYTTYYICSDSEGRVEILVRDCIQGRRQNFLPGDVITIYGEGSGNRTVYDENYNPYSAPCVNAAYVVVG